MKSTSLAEGFAETWSWLTVRGIPTVVLADSPYMKTDIPSCLAENNQKLSVCSTPRADALSHTALREGAAAVAEGVDYVDINDLICPGPQCEPIIGSVLVYRDQHHLTDSYVQTLYDPLAQRLDETGLLRAVSIDGD